MDRKAKALKLTNTIRDCYGIRLSASELAHHRKNILSPILSQQNQRDNASALATSTDFTTVPPVDLFSAQQKESTRIRHNRNRTVGQLTQEVVSSIGNDVFLPALIQNNTYKKQKPSKYDHFHEKTFINTFVPTFNTEKFYYSDYAIPDIVHKAKPGQETPLPVMSNTPKARGELSSATPRGRQMTNVFTRLQTSSMSKKPSMLSPSPQSPRREAIIRAKKQWPMLFMPDGKSLENSKFCTVDLQKYIGSGEDGELAERKLREILEYVSFSLRADYAYLYLTDGTCVTSLDRIPKDTKVCVVSNKSLFEGPSKNQRNDPARVQTAVHQWTSTNKRQIHREPQKLKSKGDLAGSRRQRLLTSQNFFRPLEGMMSYDSGETSQMITYDANDEPSEQRGYSRKSRSVKPQSNEPKSTVLPESEDLQQVYNLLLNEDDNIWLE